jgi:hypothetical protein
MAPRRHKPTATATALPGDDSEARAGGYDDDQDDDVAGEYDDAAGDEAQVGGETGEEDEAAGGYDAGEYDEYEDEAGEDGAAGGYDDEYEDDAGEYDEYEDEADEDEAAGGNYDGDTAGGKPFSPPSALSSIRNSFRSPRQRAQPASGTAEDEQRVNLINSRERMIGFFLGAMMVALGILLYVRFNHYVDKTDLKLQREYRRDAPWVGALTLGLGLMTIVATLVKRRAALAFTVLLAGVATFGSVPLIGILYLGTGLWLVFRAMRRSPRARAGSAGARPGSRARNGATSRAEDTRATSKEATRAAMAAAGRARAESTPTRSSQPGRTIGRNGRLPNASASGRYTPPKQHVPPAVQPEPEPTNRLSSWLKK